MLWCKRRLQRAAFDADKVPPRRINEIVLGKRAITADTDLHLARYFGLSEGFFLGLQTDYELMARRRQIADQLKAIRPRAALVGSSEAQPQHDQVAADCVVSSLRSNNLQL
jgi:addiction module HigA family antidote